MQWRKFSQKHCHSGLIKQELYIGHIHILIVTCYKTWRCRIYSKLALVIPKMQSTCTSLHNIIIYASYDDKAMYSTQTHCDLVPSCQVISSVCQQICVFEPEKKPIQSARNKTQVKFYTYTGILILMSPLFQKRKQPNQVINS